MLTPLYCLPPSVPPPQVHVPQEAGGAGAVPDLPGGAGQVHAPSDDEPDPVPSLGGQIKAVILVADADLQVELPEGREDLGDWGCGEAFQGGLGHALVLEVVLRVVVLVVELGGAGCMLSRLKSSCYASMWYLVRPTSRYSSGAGWATDRRCMWQ